MILAGAFYGIMVEAGCAALVDQRLWSPLGFPFALPATYRHYDRAWLYTRVRQFGPIDRAEAISCGWRLSALNFVSPILCLTHP